MNENLQNFTRKVLKNPNLFLKLPIIRNKFKNNFKPNDRQFQKCSCVFEHFPGEIWNFLRIDQFYWWFYRTSQKIVGEKSFCRAYLSITVKNIHQIDGTMDSFLKKFPCKRAKKMSSTKILPFNFERCFEKIRQQGF